MEAVDGEDAFAGITEPPPDDGTSSNTASGMTVVRNGAAVSFSHPPEGEGEGEGEGGGSAAELDEDSNRMVWDEDGWAEIRIRLGDVGGADDSWSHEELMAAELELRLKDVKLAKLNSQHGDNGDDGAEQEECTRHLEAAIARAEGIGFQVSRAKQ